MSKEEAVSILLMIIDSGILTDAGKLKVKKIIDNIVCDLWTEKS